MAMVTSADIREMIANANEDFMVAFSRGDAAGMADLYTEDGQVLPPNSDFVRGKEAIQAFWQSLMDMGIRKAKLDIVEVEEQDDLAVEVSKYTLKGEGGQVFDQGKYIVIWKQEDGHWKLHRDIFNSSLAAPQ
jgi:uncharacterized protein (TIGR02246 family)